MKKVLILMAIGERENKLSKSGMNSVDGVVTEAIYYPYHNILIRMIRKIWCNFNLPGFQIWFGIVGLLRNMIGTSGVITLKSKITNK